MKLLWYIIVLCFAMMCAPLVWFQFYLPEQTPMGAMQMLSCFLSAQAIITFLVVIAIMDNQCKEKA